MKTTGKVILAFIILFGATCKKKKDTPEPAPVITNITINTSLPSVSTIAISSVSELTASCSGVVSSEGSSAITAVGVCWDTLPGPTTLRPRTNEGAGTGSFTSYLYNLKANTMYYVRAYASNATGTAYGSELSFKTGEAWTLLNFTKNTNALLFANTYLFAATSEGIFRSSDEGMQWSPAKNGMGSISVNCMATSPTAIFAGTYGNGMFKSTDGGNSWNPANTGLNDYYILKVTAYQNIVFAATSYGLYRSTNDGGNWTSSGSGLPTSNITDIAYDGTKAYLGTPGYGLYTSNNGGASWTSAIGDISNSTYIYMIAISGPNVVVSTDSGVFTSADSGASWTKVNSIPTSQLTMYTNKNGTLYASGYNNVYISKDNGLTFKESKAGLTTSSLNSIAASDLNIFVSGYNIFRLPLAN